jgi:Transposase, Mutator family
MTKGKSKAQLIDVKELLQRDEDFLRVALQALAQAALEAEMTETIGAAKGERTETRLAYRSGYYSRSLITRVGTLELRVPQSLPRRRPGVATGAFQLNCSNAISDRRRRWSAPWRRCTCRVFRPARSRR